MAEEDYRLKRNIDLLFDAMASGKSAYLLVGDPVGAAKLAREVLEQERPERNRRRRAAKRKEKRASVPHTNASN